MNDPLRWPKAQQIALAAQYRAENQRQHERTSRQKARLALLRIAGSIGRRGAAGAAAPRRILLMRPDHLGDVLFCTPALRALRLAWPAAHITALVGPWGAGIVQHNANIDALRTLPFPGFTRQRGQPLWAPYRMLWREAQRLRDERFDLALVLRFDHWWGAWLAQLAGIPQRIGYAVPECQPFLTQAVPYQVGRHEVLQNLRLVEAATGRGNELPADLHFPVTETAHHWVQTWRAAAGLSARPVAAIHPGAGAPVKLWPAPAWAAVIDGLRRRGLAVVLTGSREEAGLADDIARLAGGTVHNLAGQTDLDQLAALFRQSQLVVGLDSGPMHLAVAVGTATVHLYGPVAAQTFGPWGDATRHRVITSDWDCIPCNRLDYGADELPMHPCVRAIEARAVLEAVDEVMAIH